MSEQESLDWPGYLNHGQAVIRRKVASSCRKYGAPGESDDLGQIILAQLWEKKEELHFDNHKKLFSYIRLMVRSKLPRERARATGRGKVQPMDPASLAEIATARGGFSADTPSMDEFLAMLDDERMREACRLRFVDELKLEAIGKRLGMSIPTVFRLLRSALEILRTQLDASSDSPDSEPVK